VTVYQNLECSRNAKGWIRYCDLHLATMVSHVSEMCGSEVVLLSDFSLEIQTRDAPIFTSYGVPSGS
jgi:hypothetical protein